MELGKEPFIIFDCIAEKLRGSSSSSSSSSSSRKKKHVKKANAWAAGTGYGGSDGVDSKIIGKAVNAAKRKEEQEDLSLQGAFSDLMTSISRLGVAKETFLRTMKGNYGLSYAIGNLFRNEDMENVGNRLGVYCSALDFFRTISKDATLKQFLLAPLALDCRDGDNGEETVLSLLTSMAAISHILTKVSGAGDDEFRLIDEHEPPAVTMAFKIRETLAAIKQNTVHELRHLKRKRLREASTSSSSSVAPTEASYEQALKGYSFKTMNLCEMIESGSQVHSYYPSSSSSTNSSSTGDPRKRLQRIAKEVATLKSIPVHFGSSIFVIADISRVDVMRVLITGPEDTPYANGVFEMDVLLPSRFPQEPPLVKLLTTGGGTVRFNPNLYANGKVCLSLLGTWTGPGWDEKNSSLLQVLISIQSLILVSDPYFNEPGYESSMGTPAGTRENERYNQNIRSQTLRIAVRNALEHADRSVFRDVIRKHFSLKRETILKQMEVWVSQSNSEALRNINACHESEVKRLLRALPTYEQMLEEERKSVKVITITDDDDETGSGLRQVKRPKPKVTMASSSSPIDLT